MPIKVITIGSDRKLFEEESAVSARVKEYSALVGELHIVVFALKSLGLKERQIAPNAWVYPTNSFSKWFYIGDAVKVGNKIVFEKKFVRGQSLITAQDPFECGWVGMKIKNKWRIPLEIQLHTDPFSPYFSGFLNILRKIIAKKVLRKADGVRVVTEILKTKLSKMTKGQITVLPIYVDRQKVEEAKIFFDLHARYGWRFVLLTVSRLAPEKNLPFALKILARVREKFPNTGLVIVGSGTEEDKLKSLAKKLKLENSVEFAGWQENLGSFYKTANVFLQTSFFEGYGLSLIEAGLSGLPVITTPVGIANDLEHGKDAYIYPVNNTESFVDGIMELIEHNEKREHLRMNMKNTLKSKLVSKEEYLKQLKDGWENTANKVQ